MAAAVAVVVVFAACEKNNSSSNNTYNNTGNNNNTTGNSGNGGGGSSSAIVSTIFDVINDLTVSFTYDAQNRVSSVNWDDFLNATITYPSANSIKVVMQENEYMFTLNSDGYIIKCCFGDFVLDYEYENGYLKREIYDDGDYIINYTWENGNLKSQQDNYGYTTYSYGTTSYKEANIAPYSPPGNSDNGSVSLRHILPKACFGKRSKNLMSSQKSSHNGNIKYRYQTNTSGYVTKVYVEYEGYEELRSEINYK